MYEKVFKSGFQHLQEGKRNSTWEGWLMPTCCSRFIVQRYKDEAAVLTEAAVGRKEVMQK